METLTPARLADRYLGDLLHDLPGAFDGRRESVHQARIATRHLREVLPLMDVPETEDVQGRVRAAGRHLGRVRELDVISGLLDSLDDRVPIGAATEWHALRQKVRRRLADTRRSTIKDLEQLDLRALREVLAPTLASRLTRWLPPGAYVVTPKWVGWLWERIVDRSGDAVAAVERAPAVYFPNRTHRVRVAVKKLRYAVEVAAETGVWRPRRVLKDLRKIQSILGELHDIQVLLDLASESSSEAASAGQTMIKDMLDAEIQRYMAEYAKRREWIPQIANVSRHAASRARWRIPRPLVAVTVLTAPLMLESLVRPARSLDKTSLPSAAPRLTTVLPNSFT